MIEGQDKPDEEANPDERKLDANPDAEAKPDPEGEMVEGEFMEENVDDGFKPGGKEKTETNEKVDLNSESEKRMAPRALTKEEETGLLETIEWKNVTHKKLKELSKEEVMGPYKDILLNAFSVKLHDYEPLENFKHTEKVRNKNDYSSFKQDLAKNPKIIQKF